MAEPLWCVEGQVAQAEARRLALHDEPKEWSSDYPIWTDEDPVWVDAYEL